MTTSSSIQPIASASTFVASIGVNTHAAYSWGAYTNASLMIDSLRYLGVTTLRDAITTDPTAAPVLNALAATGYKFDFVVASNVPASGNAGLQQFTASLDAFAAAHPGSITAVEGLNEANLFPFSFNGSSSVSAAGQFQSALYQSVKGDANLNGVSVYNMTLGLNDVKAYATLGNLAGSSDFANSHAYVATGTPQNYGLTFAANLGAGSAVGKPSVITETGYTTLQNHSALGVDQITQAKSILNTLVDAFQDGTSKTYLYQLLDQNSSPGDTNAEDHFGLFNDDGSPKLAATAIHNMTTILNDNGTGGHQPTAPLSYTLQGMPSTGNSMVLGKSNGAYDLMVWAEPKVYNAASDTDITNPTNSVSVHLGSVHQSVSVYDPLSGTAPIATYSNVQDFKVPVSDHPLIIEIDAPAAAAPAVATPPLAIRGTSAGIVAQLSALAAKGNIGSITLTDTHTLAVASQATMNYIISHYSSVLQAITGGYSFSVTNSAPTWSLTKSYDASGTLTSTSQTALSNGLPAYTLANNADGSTGTTFYANGVKTQTTIVYADHSQDKYVYGITGQSYVTQMQHLDPTGKVTAVERITAAGIATTNQTDSAGNLVSTTVQNPDGSSTTTVFSGGVKTQVFVTNADQTHDNSFYNIQGQSYTTEVQHTDAKGNVTAVTRTHADGTLAYTETTAANGAVTSTQYDAHGVKQSQALLRPDGSKDIYAFNITGQAYTTEHSGFNATGALVFYERLHADGSEALKVTNVNGIKTTDTYDASGVITGETQSFANGSSSIATYAAGVETKLTLNNADGSHDYSSFAITGQSYTSITQHADATGKVTSAVRTHADGSLDFTLQTNGDGGTTSTYYNTRGVISGQVTVQANGTKLTNAYDTAGTKLSSIAVASNGSITAQAFAKGITLTSGAGNDVFTSFQNDTIAFHAGFGQDTVYGFNAGTSNLHDVMQIDKSTVSDFSHLSMKQSGSDAIIALSSHDNVTLKGINVSSLVASDFRFV